MTYKGKYLVGKQLQIAFEYNDATIMHQDICNMILHPENNYEHDESRATSISISSLVFQDNLIMKLEKNIYYV